MDGLDKKLMGFHQIAVEKLQNILAQIPGKCDLIIEPDLIKPLEQVVGAAWLRSKGIDKIYKFDASQLSATLTASHLLYFIRGHRLVTLARALDQIKGVRNRNAAQYLDGQSQATYFHIILLPNVEAKHQRLLEEEGMHGICSLYRFSWDFLTLDTNLLSLELPEVFREVFVLKDLTVLPSIAKSLRIFDMITRKSNFVISYGSKVGKLWQMVEHLEHKRPSRNDDNPNLNDFSVMLLMDRDKDPVSSFMTPVTYTGLLTELYQTNAGHLLTNRLNRIDRGKMTEGGAEPVASKSGQASSQKGPSSIRLNSVVDKTFADNKYRHFSEVLSTLGMQAKALGVEGLEYSKDLKSVSSMKQFVEKKLPKVAAAKKELEKHLNLCEEVVLEMGKHFEVIQRLEENMAFNQNRKQTLQEIEDVFITQNKNKFLSLKLLVLFHLTFEMSEDEMMSSFSNYLSTFGHENLGVIYKLIEGGLLPDSVLSASSSSSGLGGLLQQQRLKSKILGTLPKLRTSFQTNANKLKQIPVEEPKSVAGSTTKPQPTCPSYVFNRNYIPAIAQLVSMICVSQTFEELFAKIGHLDQVKISSKLNPENTEPMPLAAMNDLIKARKFPELLPFKPKTVMVFVLGGVSYAEVAACELVGKTTGCKVVVSSNSILSGHDLLEDLF